MTDDTSSPEDLNSFKFSTEKEKYDKLIASFKDEQDKVLERRKIRENKRNVQEERRKGTILEDETIVPDRTVNTNIRVGRSPYISYITQSKRLLIITEIDKPDLPVEPLELWFTRGMRYPKWKLPWIKLVDCMHTHGGSAVEVMYDEEKPLSCTIEYIPRESLIIPCKARNIQGQPHVLREYDLTVLELEEYAAKYNFNPDIVKELQDKHAKDDKPIKVYKVFCKKAGVVYNSWYTKESDKSWLRDPIVHDIGLFQFDPGMIMEMTKYPEWDTPMAPGMGTLAQQMATPLPLRQYPIIWFPYEVTENEVLLEAQGRVALDVHEQEALTHLLTNTVNATRRASNFYPCAKNDATQDTSGRELLPLKPGFVYPFELATFQPNWPNNIILAVMQAMRVDNANRAGHNDYAAVARKDANKTATEMELATQQAQTTITSDMDIYSDPVLDVWALCFTIARHQAIFGLCKRPIHPELLFGDYNLVPAGDVEVVKREEDKANAKEFFNIAKGTPLAERILMKLIRMFFPDQADEWISALSGPDKDQIILQLINLLQGLMKDVGDTLPQDHRAAVATLIAAAQSVVGTGDNPPVPPETGVEQSSTTAASTESTANSGQLPANS